jgi:hypothetical protein
VFKTPKGIVLALTLCQLSAINCAACKKSALAMTSLADDGDDYVSTFLFFQGCSLPTL